MRAVIAPEPGGPEALQIVDRPELSPGRGELLVRVAGSAVNRADLLQRKGLYPPPEGATDVLGLEAAGAVAAVGDGVEGWSEGDGICAVLPGGGYAEQALVPAVVAMPLPPGLSPVEAAAVPEVFATAYDNVFRRGRLLAGETVLIHGGASGVGTATIQLAKRSGCRALVTAGSRERVDQCVELGADGGVVYRDDDWSKTVLEMTDGRGVDVVLDIVGGPYLRANLRCLATEGRLVIIGLMGGAKAEIDLSVLLSRRVAVMGSTLRARSTEEKAPLARRLVSDVWPGFGDRSLRPVIDRVLPLAAIAEAHTALEAGDVFGKIVLDIAG
ncbi:MAG: zinc-binding dehydrogenase [Nitriliruptorales bacterium]|nr:zinc-binding dehydrogenase [Nitriliruptorales bacterium]